MADASMLHVKRVYDPASPDDGKRFLVDRLWPRGVSKERAQLVAWRKDVAPSAELRAAFHKKGMPYKDFAKAYAAELDANDAAREFAEQCEEDVNAGTPVTLVFAKKDEQRNNAVVLRDWIVGRTS